MSERISPAELEVQRFRIQDILQKTHNQVWSNRRFPNAHVPDVATLRNNIFFNIDDAPEVPFEPHPLLRPEILAQSNANLVDVRQQIREEKDSWYDPLTRATVYKPQFLRKHDESVRRAVYNSAGADNATKIKAILPDKYSPEDHDAVTYALRTMFAGGVDIPISQTQIDQGGHRRILMASGYIVGELEPPEVLIINEMYPIAFELITDQLVRRQGDFHTFEQDAQKGRIQLTSLKTDQNASYAQTLFATLERVNWKDILTALAIPDVEESVGHLEKATHEQGIGGKIFVALYKAIERDKNRNEQLLELYRRLKGM